MLARTRTWEWRAPNSTLGVWEETHEVNIGSRSWESKSTSGATGWKCVCLCGLVTQSCPTLFKPADCSLPGSSVHGILQKTQKPHQEPQAGKVQGFYLVFRKMHTHFVWCNDSLLHKPPAQFPKMWPPLSYGALVWKPGILYKSWTQAGTGVSVVVVWGDNALYFRDPEVSCHGLKTSDWKLKTH